MDHVPGHCHQDSGKAATAALQIIPIIETEMALAAPDAVGFSFMSFSTVRTGYRLPHYERR